jgi:basic membrane lipoprotein Med (substrate-binding protein (PBP1-ABC) superfamily)
VGYIAGPETIATRNCDHQYEDGAKLFHPNREIVGGYAASFYDPDEGIKVADNLIEQDVAVILNIAGETGNVGILHAAEKGLWVIGSGSDQYVTLFENGNAPGSDRILTSVISDFPEALNKEVNLILEGDFGEGKFMEYGRQPGDEGVYVYLAPMHEAKPDIPAPAMQAIKNFLQKRLQ